MGNHWESHINFHSRKLLNSLLNSVFFLKRLVEVMLRKLHSNPIKPVERAHSSKSSRWARGGAWKTVVTIWHWIGMYRKWHHRCVAIDSLLTPQKVICFCFWVALFGFCSALHNALQVLQPAETEGNSRSNPSLIYTDGFWVYRYSTVPHRWTVKLEIVPRLPWNQGSEDLFSCTWTELQIRKGRRGRGRKAAGGKFYSFLYRRNGGCSFRESWLTLMQTVSVAIITRA